MHLIVLPYILFAEVNPSYEQEAQGLFIQANQPFNRNALICGALAEMYRYGEKGEALEAIPIVVPARDFQKSAYWVLQEALMNQETHEDLGELYGNNYRERDYQGRLDFLTYVFKYTAAYQEPAERIVVSVEQVVNAEGSDIKEVVNTAHGDIQELLLKLEKFTDEDTPQSNAAKHVLDRIKEIQKRLAEIEAEDVAPSTAVTSVAIGTGSDEEDRNHRRQASNARRQEMPAHKNMHTKEVDGESTSRPTRPFDEE